MKEDKLGLGWANPKEEVKQSLQHLGTEKRTMKTAINYLGGIACVAILGLIIILSLPN